MREHSIPESARTFAAPPEGQEPDFMGREAMKVNLFRSEADIKAYQTWRETVPAALRQAVEGHLLNTSSLPDASLTPLVGQFCAALTEALRDPTGSLTARTDLDPRIGRQLERLQAVTIDDKTIVNVVALLADQNVPFAAKLNYVQNQVLPRWQWLAQQDAAAWAEYEKTPAEIDLLPADDEDSYTPHRAPNQESEGLPGEALALVYPFFGGYYKDGVFSEYDPVTLTWKKSARVLESMPPTALVAGKERVYRTQTRAGARTVLKLPYGWGVASKDGVQMFRDQNGIISVVLPDVTADTVVQLTIGPTVETIASSTAAPADTRPPVVDHFPIELVALADEIMTTPHTPMVKARRLVAAIRNHLEYDMDMQWEGIYKADPSRYFEAMWTHKKAKCDEANTLAARLLAKYGYAVNFISGHSVQTTSPQGEAMLTADNAHAWIEVWNAAGRDWVRLDATPKGDPNVNEDQQDQDLGEGDYGEQEAELMTEEELQERLVEIQENPGETPLETPADRFAAEAGCTPAEAKSVLDTIARLRTTYRSLLTESKDYWQRLVRKNFKKGVVYEGPRRMSEGDELDDVVEARIGVVSGESDPLGWNKEVSKKEIEKVFGGYEVYIAVDMSYSTNETIGGVKKVDTERDTTFLLVDSIMSSAAVVRGQEYSLRSPMPVKISVIVFGARTEIVLPLTDTWGPAEQIRLYRALNAGAGGGTPDHMALGLIEQQIAASQAEEIARSAVKKPSAKKSVAAPTHRSVIVVADGESDNARAVKAVTSRIEAAGIPIDLFLIAAADNINLHKLAQAAYPSVSVVSDPTDLARVGLETLTDRIKMAYGN